MKEETKKIVRFSSQVSGISRLIFLVQNARERLILDNIIILLIIFENTRWLRNLLLRRERLGLTLRGHRVHYRRILDEHNESSKVQIRRFNNSTVSYSEFNIFYTSYLMLLVVSGIILIIKCLHQWIFADIISQ